MAYDTFSFNIVEPLGVIAEYTDHKGEKKSKEVNLVSWNGKEPKVDIREWNEDHSRMSKGLSITNGEAEILCMILHNYMRERSK